MAICWRDLIVLEFQLAMRILLESRECGFDITNKWSNKRWKMLSLKFVLRYLISIVQNGIQFRYSKTFTAIYKLWLCTQVLLEHLYFSLVCISSFISSKLFILNSIFIFIKESFSLIMDKVTENFEAISLWNRFFLK